MKKILIIIPFIMVMISCNSTSHENELKEKELELKQKELQIREDSLKSNAKSNNSSNIADSVRDTPKEEIKCDSKYQLSGKLIKVVYDGDPCAYVYLKILTVDGKKLDLYIDGNYSSFTVGNSKLFKWSSKRIEALLSSSTSIGVQFPNDALEFTLIGKEYLFCCSKKQINCGDDPNSPKQFFCKQALNK